MSTIYRFAPHDERIDAECHRLLPDQPHVAAYIASRLREGDGSVLVARLMCEALESVGPSAVVSHATVQALAVEVESNGAESNKDRLRRMCAAVRSRDHHFTTRGAHFLFTLQGSQERWKTDDGTMMMRAPLAVKQGKEANRYFGAVFNCAYAMLMGLPTSAVMASEAA